MVIVPVDLMADLTVDMSVEMMVALMAAELVDWWEFLSVAERVAK